jgi:hypothetical protein
MTIGAEKDLLFAAGEMKFHVHMHRKGKGKGRFFGVYSALRLCKPILPSPLKTSFLHH